MNSSGFPFRLSVSPTGSRCWAPALPSPPAVVSAPCRAGAERRRESVSRDTEGAGRAGRGGVRLNRDSGLGQFPGSSGTGAEPIGAGPTERCAGSPDPTGFSRQTALRS